MNQCVWKSYKIHSWVVSFLQTSKGKMCPLEPMFLIVIPLSCIHTHPLLIAQRRGLTGEDDAELNRKKTTGRQAECNVCLCVCTRMQIGAALSMRLSGVMFFGGKSGYIINSLWILALIDRYVYGFCLAGDLLIFPIPTTFFTFLFRAVLR